MNYKKISKCIIAYADKRRKYTVEGMNSIAVARGCSCYTMCTCKNRQSLKSYYNIKTTITEYSSAEGI